VLWIFTPFQKALSKSGHQEPDISEELIDNCVKSSEPGDIILTYETGRPTANFIRGPMDHAAIITDLGTVMEAVTDRFVQDLLTKSMTNIGGVREVTLKPFLCRKNQFVIIRPVYKDIDRKINVSAGTYSRTYKGRGYDHQFRIDNEKVYCSELVYLSYRRFDQKFMEHISIYDEILPDDYLKLTTDSKRDDLKFQIIYDTRNQ